MEKVVSNAPQPAIPVCNHERRPGTTVCLHCRHAERLAAAQRRKKLLLRGAALAIVVAVVSTTGLLSANVLRDRLSSRGAASRAPARVVATAETSPPAPIVQQGDVGPIAPPLTPVISPGESILDEGIAAMRVDSSVTLSFDTPMLRTRIPDKFERFLRTTLREVYGPAIDSTLARLPDGTIASQGDLLRDLPVRGIHIPVSSGWSIAVFPETRPGQDGPLVVRYRVALGRD